jgi:hypothetical protein
VRVDAHPGAAGRVEHRDLPGDGAKLRDGSSALIRHSMAWPRSWIGVSGMESGSPAAARICSFTRSNPVHISVTGCSTWMRVFISMK